MAACLSNITEISREECIGNSLPIINDNFTNMKNYVCSLETGQEGIIEQLQFLIPLYGVINFYGDIVLGGVNFELDGKGKQNIVQGIDLRAYHLCNGNNGTPDLRDRFVVGSGGTYVHREFGPLYNSTASLAFSSVKLTIPEMPIHTHGITEPNGGQGHSHTGSASSTDSEHSHKFKPPTGTWEDSDTAGSDDGWQNDGGGKREGETQTDGKHSHTLSIDRATTDITINNEGGSLPHENRPPYMALAYIMRYK
jgi:microcystin-dependent protein